MQKAIDSPVAWHGCLKPKKALKTMLSEEIATALLTLVKLADGAKDNWTYLGAALPPGVELIDYYMPVTTSTLEDFGKALIRLALFP